MDEDDFNDLLDVDIDEENGAEKKVTENKDSNKQIEKSRENDEEILNSIGNSNNNKNNNNSNILNESNNYNEIKVESIKNNNYNNNSNNLNLNNLYAQVNISKEQSKKLNTNTNKNYKNDIKNDNFDNYNSIGIPFQSLEEKTFLTEQANLNKNKNNKTINNNNLINKEIKEEEASTSEKNDDKKIRFLKFKRQKTDKLEIKINAILKRTNRLQNNFDKMEEAYNELKKPLEELLSKPETKDEAEIIRQNSKILMFFDLLNKILALVSDNPMPIFRTKKNIINKNKKNKDINELLKEEKEKIDDNNQKMISNYESEIKRMKNILEKVRDDNYEKKLDEKIKIKKNDILITEKKINELKLTIKQRELEQDHEQKKNSKEIILKNLTCDYKIKR
jgi:hypothetical protein